MNNYAAILQNAQIRPSVQRLAVYSYLCEHPVHPDVETVFDALNPSYPTLSKTTVYNTLKLFEEKKIIQSIKIDDDKLRFDATVKEHFHFKCTKCGQIYDVFDDLCAGEKSKVSLPGGFIMEKIQTNIWGVCCNCK